MVSLDARDFQAPLAGSFKALTVIVFVGVMAVLVGVGFLAAREGLWTAMIPVFIIPAAFGIAALYRPVGYRLTETGVAVLRPIGPTEIPYSAIKDVSIGNEWLKFGVIGVFRSGGFFGVYGLFYKRGVGMFRAYVTDLSRCVSLHVREGRPMMVSPHDPALFAAQVKERLTD